MPFHLGNDVVPDAGNGSTDALCFRVHPFAPVPFTESDLTFAPFRAKIVP